VCASKQRYLFNEWTQSIDFEWVVGEQHTTTDLQMIEELPTKLVISLLLDGTHSRN